MRRLRQSQNASFFLLCYPLLASPATRLCCHRESPAAAHQSMVQAGSVVKLFVGQIPKTLEEDGVREGACE